MHRNANVRVLMLAGALGMSAAPLVVFIGGLVGAALAPQPVLATLPVAAIVVGTALGIIPVTRLMQRWGRRRVFIGSALLMAGVALAAAACVLNANFWFFVACMVAQGVGLSVVQQYRFAAMESVHPDVMAKAASFVLLGGLIAAFLGPEVAHAGRQLFAVEFVGSFVLLALLSAISGVVLIFYKNQDVLNTSANALAGRPLSELFRQPVLWVALLSAAIGYAVMSYIMTATPLSMNKVCGYSLEQTKWVIQGHIVAMYLPSFFSGRLIQRFGVERLIWSGLVLYGICIFVAYSGQGLWHFWIALICLGLGWNFLFVGGTALLPRSYEGDERYAVQGVNDFMVFGTQAVAALSSGVVIFALGWQTLVVLALPFIILHVAVMVRWQQRK